MSKTKITIPVIYEDEHILVLNKPAGIAVHNTTRKKEESVAEWVVAHYPGVKDVGEKEEGIERSGIVHRLDKETSGVLVVAKDQPTYLYLKKQFAERTTQKTYRAFAYGSFGQKRGIIDKPIGRSAGAFAGRAAGGRARGEVREAVTIYKVLGETKDTKGGAISYLEVFPKTGRTHQIRVHLSSIQHPVVCDVLYAPKRGTALGFKRLALHSYSLDLSLPMKKGRKTFVAPLPKDFLVAQKSLAKARQV